MEDRAPYIVERPASSGTSQPDIDRLTRDQILTIMSNAMQRRRAGMEGGDELPPTSIIGANTLIELCSMAASYDSMRGPLVEVGKKVDSVIQLVNSIADRNNEANGEVFKLLEELTKERRAKESALALWHNRLLRLSIAEERNAAMSAALGMVWSRIGDEANYAGRRQIADGGFTVDEITQLTNAAIKDEHPDNTAALPVFFYEREFYPFSNFSAFRLRWKGLDFDTSEAAYQWEKFIEPNGQESQIQRNIREARSAHEAFKIAEMWKESRRENWDDWRVGIMKQILRAKAAQHEYVRRKLEQTGNRILIEDSWRDSWWGWGADRNGLNMLGKLWMEVRQERREGAPPCRP